MKRHSESWAHAGGEYQREDIIGLGHRSLRKSYYGALQARITELTRFRALLDASSDAIILAELPGFRVVDVNRAGQRLLSCSSDSVRGQPLESLFDPCEWCQLETHLRLRREQPGMPGPGLLTLRREGEARVLEFSVREDAFGPRRYLVLVARDVTERVRAEKALRKAKEEAEAADRAKARFLTIASHELRTPLTALMLQLQQATRRPERLSATGSGLLERMLKQARWLAAMAEDLLDVSRLEHDRLVLRKERLDLRSLVAEVVSDFRARASERHLGLELPPVPVYVEADPTRTEQVLSNLLENALQYSPPGTPVEVRLTLKRGRACVSVKDNGPGIAEEDRKRLFKPFGRLGAAGQGTPPGLGLGLYLSRRIAELQGGELRAEPASGRGSTFSLDLPLACELLQAEAGDTVPGDLEGPLSRCPLNPRRLSDDS
jgi:PAS domain S-box-containing protein